MNEMKKGKKLWIAMGVTTAIVATFNLHLNMQKTKTNVSLVNIEVLTDELTAFEQEILLIGSLIDRPLRSFSTPFNAVKYSSYIAVSYLSNLSNITVQIVSASGQTVYTNIVNPVAGGQLYISLAELPSGDYTIVFVAPNGSSMYGNFEI
jgi:hypothetical protein